MGMFIHETWDHPRLIQAREQADPEMLAYWLNRLRQPDGSMDTSDYLRVEREASGNLLTLQGEAFMLDCTLAVRSGGNLTAPNANLHWYFAEFSNDAAPLNTWTAASFASGGAATEFTGYDEATRPECLFVAAAGTAVVSSVNTTRATYTVSTGVSATIYGCGLLSNSTKQHSGSGAFLLAATRYSSTKTYAAGQVQQLVYQCYMPAQS